MKKAILSCLMLVAGLTASAQEQKGTTEYVFEPHWYVQVQPLQKGTTEYVFEPHWYVQVQPLGVQYTLGETKFGDLLSYNVQAAVGRQFTQLWGARLAVNAWQSKGGSDYKYVTYNGQSSVNWKYNYIAPTIDGTLNLSNLVCGFNPKRVFNLSAFAGVGLNFSWNQKEAREANATILANNAVEPLHYMGKDANGKELWKPISVVGQFGLIGDIKINDNWAINLELAANTLNDSYNTKKAGNWDWYFNALAGVKYNFGKTYSTRFIPAPEPEIRYVEKIVEKIVEVPAPVQAETAATAAEPLRRDIFFTIGKTIIRKSEQKKVNDVVEYLKANPEAKVNVTGYADAGTGNDRINDRLSEEGWYRC